MLDVDIMIHYIYTNEIILNFIATSSYAKLSTLFGIDIVVVYVNYVCSLALSMMFCHSREIGKDRNVIQLLIRC